MDKLVSVLMPLLSPLLAPLQGYKTYIGAAGFLALATMSLLNSDYNGAASYFSLFMATAGLRSAISKLE